MKNVSISWSGGKDSAFMLYKLLGSVEYRVVELHTTFNSETNRVGMHGIAEELIDAQAEALGLPLVKLYLPSSENYNTYEQVMKDYFEDLSNRGITAVAFGDIFLQDLKHYRENLLWDTGLEAVFPLWGYNSKDLLKEFHDAGFKAKVCAAGSHFHAQELGKDLNEIDLLLKNIDPCGEFGEYHTFVYQGPLFNRKIPIELKEVVERKYTYRVKTNQGMQEEQKKFLFQDMVLEG